ncbi:hypothetical protein BGX34_003650 [Mortierella sp. NVP85]|nr:hypothetical protein BGX34_003650 [Mortierella sp. NVP85]
MYARDLYADIKMITDRFFALGSIANFLDAFVRDKGALPVIHGPIRGLPRAWRRNTGVEPSLLILDLPDPAVPDLTTKNSATGSIFNKVKGDNRPHISDCGKTHAPGRSVRRTLEGDFNKGLEGYRNPNAEASLSNSIWFSIFRSLESIAEDVPHQDREKGEVYNVRQEVQDVVWGTDGSRLIQTVVGGTYGRHKQC